MSHDPSQALLKALSGELATMAETVDALSSLVERHVRQSQGEARQDALVEAQVIDALSQRLRSLSGLTSAVAHGQDVDTALDAVRLSDLALRLRSAPSSVETIVAPPSGDVLLFD